MNKLPAFPIKKIKPSLSRFLRPASLYLIKIFPNTSRYLAVTGNEMDPVDYMGLATLNAVFIFTLLFSLLTILSFVQKSFGSFFAFSLIASLVMGVFTI